MASFTKREILEHIVGNTELTPAINYILKKLNVCEQNITSDTMDRLRKALFSLRSKRNSKFEAACRKRNYFESRNSSWLDSEFKIPDQINVVANEKSTATPGPGRSPVPFDEKSKRSKRREVAVISASVQHDPQKILMACRYAARRSGANDRHALLGKFTDAAIQKHRHKFGNCWIQKQLKSLRRPQNKLWYSYLTTLYQRTYIQTCA